MSMKVITTTEYILYLAKIYVNGHWLTLIILSVEPGSNKYVQTREKYSNYTNVLKQNYINNWYAK